MAKKKKKLEPYVPRHVDLDFFRTLIHNLKDMSYWCLPSTGQVYQVDKSTCTFTLVDPAFDHTRLTMRMHHHNYYTLKKLGWKCLPEVNWEDL